MKSFSEFISEKTIFDYLLFPPEGKELKLATEISKLKNDRNYVYRGLSKNEYKALLRDKKVTSLGHGNTRDVKASYLSDDVQLAGRFALRNWKDKKGGLILFIRKDMLPDLTPADEGNYYTSYIPLNAVKKVHELT